MYLKSPPVEELDRRLGTSRWMVKKSESKDPFERLDKGLKGSHLRRVTLRVESEIRKLRGGLFDARGTEWNGRFCLALSLKKCQECFASIRMDFYSIQDHMISSECCRDNLTPIRLINSARILPNIHEDSRKRQWRLRLF